MQSEVELYTKEQLYDMIKLSYAGRAAEELFIGSITTGAADDLQKATRLASQFVGSFGMSKDFGIGVFPSSGSGASKHTKNVS